MPIHKITDAIDNYIQRKKEKVSLSEDDDYYWLQGPTIFGLLDDLDANVDSPVAAEIYLTAIAQVFHRHGAKLELTYRWSHHRSRMWLNQQFKN